MRARAAALLARLERHRALLDEIGRGVGVDDGNERGVQVLDRRGDRHGLLDGVGELPVGTVLERALALRGGLGEERIEVDSRRRAAAFLRLDRRRAAGRGLEPEAHHGLVDRADLLDIERAVGDALAVKDEELLERAVDRAVGDQRRLDALHDLPRARLGPPLQELVPVGIEEDAVALGKPHAVRLGAVVDHPEENEELRPGAVALVHGVGIERRVGAQAVVEARDRVAAQKGLVLGEHVALLGVEEKDETQKNGEERAVDLVGALGEDLAK